MSAKEGGGGAAGDVIGGGEAEAFEGGDRGGAGVEGHEFEAQTREIAEGVEARGEVGAREKIEERGEREIVVAGDLGEFEPIEQIAEEKVELDGCGGSGAHAPSVARGGGDARGDERMTAKLRARVVDARGNHRRGRRTMGRDGERVVLRARLDRRGGVCGAAGMASRGTSLVRCQEPMDCSPWDQGVARGARGRAG